MDKNRIATYVPINVAHGYEKFKRAMSTKVEPKLAPNRKEEGALVQKSFMLDRVIHTSARCRHDEHPFTSGTRMDQSLNESNNK